MRAQLNKTFEVNDGTVKSLNDDISHLCNDLEVSQSMVEQLNEKKRKLQQQLTEVNVARLESERSWKEAAELDQQEFAHLQRELEAS